MNDLITLDERSELYQLEEVIERGLKTFVDVGNALLKIRDGRLYREEYSTFEEYCQTRWNMSRIHAHRMIDAASVTNNLLPIGNILPATESQARPLASLEPAEQLEAWKRVITSTPEGKITAAIVLKAAKEVEREKREERIRELPADKYANLNISVADNIATFWGVNRGQVWRCGEHLVICGDCNDPDILAKATRFGSPDVLLNDPPYGMSLDTDYSKLPSTRLEGNKTYAPVRGDDKQFEYNNLGLNCKEEFWFGADYYRRTIPDGGSWLVWDKRVDEKFDAMFGSAFELIWSKNKHKREIIRCNNTLFSGEAEAKNKLHPTTKPTKVIDWILSRYSVQGQLVMDMYAGSGTTLIVCNNLKLRNVSIEIEPMYIGVILQRFYDITGVKPELEV